MGEQTAIAWTDHTFNPWWGCTRVSPGCEHCYAETFAKRTGHDVWGKRAERRFFGDKHWAEPLRWNAAAEASGVPARVFCASMADVFEDRPELVEPRLALFQLVESTPHLIWQLLTKRPQNVLGMVPASWRERPLVPDGIGSPIWPGQWPANVWIGTTAEDQQRADERIPLLLKIPAAVRFLSCEPLIGPVDLSAPDVLRPLALVCGTGPRTDLASQLIGSLIRAVGQRMGGHYVDWVICGGESGPGHRPLDVDHARTLRDQCAAVDVPFFFKQHGGRTPTAGGDLLDGVQHKAFPA